MEPSITLIPVHPRGESEITPKYPSGTWPINTSGGRYHAEWDDQALVTREGQLIFFFQFLQTGGRWEDHSYFVANLRISLGVDVRPGNEHAAAKGLPGLWETLEKIPHHQWPTFTRGDSGYGNENMMLEHEERGLLYLFKLRHTAKVKELVTRMMRQMALW